MHAQPQEKDSGVVLGEAFHQYLVERNLKATRQRSLIVETFGRLKSHVSVEELLAEVKKTDTAIGYATVYRTLNLLVDARLASIRHFGDRFARFELRNEDHHDHLICEKCGKIVEFHDERIETRQEVVAKEKGFILNRHRHELYGFCRDCR